MEAPEYLKRIKAAKVDYILLTRYLKQTSYSLTIGTDKWEVDSPADVVKFIVPQIIVPELITTMIVDQFTQKNMTSAGFRLKEKEETFKGHGNTSHTFVPGTLDFGGFGLDKQ